MADGYIARKTNTASKLGEVLDSIADFVFIAAMLFVFAPIIPCKEWMLYWIAGIAVLFFLPLIYLAAGLTITTIIIEGLTSLSALEELIITIHSKRMDRNIRGIWLLRSLQE